MNIVGIDCEHESDETMAKSMLQTIVQHYPGHDWHVLVRGGVIHIKNLSWSGSWGMCLHYKQLKQDAGERAKDIVRSVGEFLERSHMIRGRAEEGKRVEIIEGLPEKHMRKVRNQQKVMMK